MLLAGSLLVMVATSIVLVRPTWQAGRLVLTRNPLSLGTAPDDGQSLGANVPQVGYLAPPFRLTTLAGRQVALADFRGHPVLINFWASWCVPCRKEMPELVQLYTTHRAAGLVVLGVNLTYQDSLTDARSFAREFNVPFPVLLDETGAIARDLYRLPGIPVSMLVDRNGRLVRQHIGPMSMRQFEAFVVTGTT